jgi:tripartite-type tricarboxylate transporter receptor subunit TctC
VHPAFALMLSAVQRLPSSQNILGAALAAMLSVLLPEHVRAQEVPYPARAVRIVVPYATGAGDSVTRVVAQKLSERMNQQFLVENRPGAGGATGAAHVAKSAPDGYTLAFTAVSHSVMTAMQPNLSFDPQTDLMPIGFMVTQPYVLAVRADAPYKTVKELVAYAKAHPGQVRLAHPGVGTLVHLVAQWFSVEAGIELNQIPYASSGPALQSVLAGQTDVLVDPPSNTLPQLQSGRLRVLASTGAQRLQALPDVPTLKELGLPVTGATWFGLSAPAKTPQAIVERLNRELNAALQDEAVKQKLEGMHYTIETGSPASYGRFFAEQTTLWAKVVKDNNLVGKAP